jgi:hypothetical protein
MLCKIHFMTKAQRRTKKAIAAILDATGLTQTQLAEMIGASLDTVKGWTRKNPKPITRKFESLILKAIGAKIMDDGSVITNWQGSLLVENRFENPKKHDYSIYETIYYGGIEPAGKPFTRETFTFWRTYVAKSNAQLAALYSYHAANVVRQIFHAAIQPVRGQKNLPAVWTSFCEWQKDTTEKFNLSSQLDKMGKNYFRDTYIIPTRKSAPPCEYGLFSPVERPPTFAPDLPVIIERKNRAGKVVETQKTMFQFLAGRKRQRPPEATA